MDAFESHEGLFDPKRMICIWLDRIITHMGINVEMFWVVYQWYITNKHLKFDRCLVVAADL